MATINLYDIDAGAVSELSLRDDIFGVAPKAYLIQAVVRAQMNAKRSGTACTKTRGQVALSTKKLYRQKGTGHARRGSAGSPLLRKGGVTFGPKPRSYKMKVNRKERFAAMKMAISEKAQNGLLAVIKPFDMEKPKTKEALRKLQPVLNGDTALVVLGPEQESLRLSLRNLQEIKPTLVAGLNVYDLLRYNRLVILESALAAIEERLGK